MDQDLTLEYFSFEQCVELSPELAELRRKYAAESADDRRKAADFEYYSAVAGSLFSRALASAGQDPFPFGEQDWPEGVVPLAIDPLFAPALLTVGSWEYHLGRDEAAMRLFLRLTTLPPDEEDLAEIIDKAGDFLIDENDYENAEILYSAAKKAYPDVAVYPAGLGYCFGKQGKYEAALEEARLVDRMEPDNHLHLNDLGWSLSQAGNLKEAEKTLERAVELAPDDYDLAGNNLECVRGKMKKKRK